MIKLNRELCRNMKPAVSHRPSCQYMPMLAFPQCSPPRDAKHIRHITVNYLCPPHRPIIHCEIERLCLDARILQDHPFEILLGYRSLVVFGWVCDRLGYAVKRFGAIDRLGGASDRGKPRREGSTPRRQRVKMPTLRDREWIGANERRLNGFLGPRKHVVVML